MFVCACFCVYVHVCLCVFSYCTLFFIIVCNLFSHPDLQVKVSFLYPTNPTYAELECHSMCGLAGDPRYILFRNGHYVGQGVKHWANIHSGDSFSCAVEGYERLRSPLVCKSPPPYSDMIPDVMGPLGYRTTCYMLVDKGHAGIQRHF